MGTQPQFDATQQALDDTQRAFLGGSDAGAGGLYSVNERKNMQLNHRPSEFEKIVSSNNVAAQRIKRFFIRLFWLGIFITVGLLLGRLLTLVPSPNSPSRSLASFLIGLPVAFIIAVYGSILIHEIGHLVAGRLVNFRFVRLIVGPLMVGKGANGLYFSYSGFRANQLQGRAQSIPTDTQDLQRRLAWMYAGGPVATFLQLIGGLSLLYLLREMTISALAADLLLTFTILPLAILPFTILPLKFQGCYSDGLRLWIFLVDKARTEYILARYQIALASITGTRLRDLDLEPLHHQTGEIKDTQEKFGAHLLYYWHILDQDDQARAAVVLDACLDLLAQTPGTLLAAFVFAEAAYYEARYNKDALTGDRWLDLAEASYEKNHGLEVKSALKRAESAVLLAEDEPEEAYLAAQEGLKFLEQSPNQGYVQAEREWLTKLAEEAKTSLDVSDLKPRREKWQESSPWLITKSVTGMLLRFTLFFAVVIIVSAFVLDGDLRYQLLGIYYARGGNYATAIDYYNRGLEVADSDRTIARFYARRGIAYSYQNQPEQAIDDLTRAIDLQPRGDYYFSRGLLHYHLEAYEMAISDFNECLILGLAQDDQIKALFYRAAAHNEVGSPDLASKDYEMLLTLPLNLTERQNAQRFLNELKK